MSAVATATPAMSVAGSWSRELPSPPAKPPASATARSHMVGVELSMMAAVVVPRGESLKYSVDVTRQKTICSARLAMASTVISRSSVAMPYAMARTEPMSGQMSMAPTMAMSESISRPMLAMSMAMMRMHRWEPVRRAPFTKRLRITW